MTPQSSPESTGLASIDITAIDGNIPLVIRRGEVIMVAGPNGAGKSALLYSIYRSIEIGRARYYAGHRQITFNHGWDNVSQDIDELSPTLFRQYEQSNRYKNHWSEEIFKSIIKRLTQEDAQYKSKVFDLIDTDLIEAQSIKKNKNSPIEILNSVFQSARLPIQFKIGNRGIRATKGGDEYEIDQLSDGERSALLIAAAVLIQEPNTIIAIDEPERNLHPSVAAPLINSLVANRPDIAFIFASHDVNLISGSEINALIYVRDSYIRTPKPENRVFDAKVIRKFESIDEGLKRDLLGARQKILFVEGTLNSIDFHLYNILFSDWKVTPKGGAQEVIDAVRSLRRNSQLHWVEAVGLIDRDGRPDNEIDDLEASGVYALKCPTSENLLFLPDVINAVARTLFEAEGAPALSVRMDAATKTFENSLDASCEEIAARLAVWRINRSLAESKVSVSDIRSSALSTVTLDLQKIVEVAQSEIVTLCATTGGLGKIQSIPIKNTAIGSRIAGAIGCDINKFKKIVFRQISLDTESGEMMRNAMREFLPTLRVP